MESIYFLLLVVASATRSSNLELLKYRPFVYYTVHTYFFKSLLLNEPHSSLFSIPSAPEKLNVHRSIGRRHALFCKGHTHTHRIRRERTSSV